MVDKNKWCWSCSEDKNEYELVREIEDGYKICKDCESYHKRNLGLVSRVIDKIKGW